MPLDTETAAPICRWTQKLVFAHEKKDEVEIALLRIPGLGRERSIRITTKSRQYLI
jgi:hypothetical protein